MKQILQMLRERKQDGRKSLAILLDTDKLTDKVRLHHVLQLLGTCPVDLVMVGGSLLVENQYHECLSEIRKNTSSPVVLFPGHPGQISPEADAILLLSLISGRNADLLIGQHVVAAPRLKQSKLEIIPTGYMLVDGGEQTTASYISQTLPLPWHKPEIAAVTAMAGEMLGLQCMYLDGGSGAKKPVSTSMIRAVREAVDVPLIVGGGIREESQVHSAYEAGADLVVVGTAFEEEPELLFALVNTRDSFQNA
jgi:putative glycerol-1-phosphate prenyltransferase